MNCQQFENIINDLASERLLEVSVRLSGLAHAEICARCAARFSDERLLTAGLRLLEADTATENAPARIKMWLGARFPGRAVPQLTRVNEHVRSGRSRWHWHLAVAAAVLLFLVTAAGRWLHLQPHQETTAIKPSESIKPSVPTAQESSRASLPPNTLRDEAATRPSSLPSSSRGRPAADRSSVARGLDGKSNATELATEYIPLTYFADSTALETGQVVRVQIPRSALIPLGLAVNVERERELVKADIVLGDDGLARAIRFVY